MHRQVLLMATIQEYDFCGLEKMLREPVEAHMRFFFRRDSGGIRQKLADFAVPEFSGL